MAKAAEKVKEESMDLTKAGNTAVAGLEDMMSEAEALGGAGRTKGIDDNQVPFLKLLQDLNPQVKKRDPAYIEGAEPGDILNTATGRVYKGSTPEKKGDIIVVQPWGVDHCINKWVPRELGGGFQGRFPLTGSPEDTMRKLGAVQRPDPKDPNKFDWVLDGGKLQLVDTRYVYVNLLEEGQPPFPCVIAFSSTGHTVAKKWSTLRNASFLPNGAEHPIWFRKYHMTSQAKKNAKGEFFVLDFVNPPMVDGKDTGWVTDKQVRMMAEGLAKSLAAGDIRAADETDETDGAGGAKGEAEKAGL
jgi:hypothetical protein